ncbi:hypothetical protein MMC18_003044 [Xylographa bjoerkii]|nr:hypothetical protein [Xylographa bjoerkii]
MAPTRRKSPQNPPPASQPATSSASSPPTPPSPTTHSRPSATEYQRLRSFPGWKRADHSRDSDQAWAAYRTALVRDFNRLFGTDAHDLLAWQTVCARARAPASAALPPGRASWRAARAAAR